MTTRHLIGYALLLLLIAGIAVAIWRANYNSEKNVLRRERRARNERRRAQATQHADEQAGPAE
jgi:hypothetical protein